MTNAILTGLMLGGMYALIAMGLTLQYGVARIMNLSYGEFLIAAAFASHWLFTGWAVSPFAGLALIVPSAFVLNFAIYKVLLTPLVRRAPNRDALEVDSILATFGLTFVIQGSMLALFGGAYSATRSSPSLCSFSARPWRPTASPRSASPSCLGWRSIWL